MIKSPPDITALEIADWFLATAKSEGRSLRPMKLQKLVYFAYGWYYYYYDASLFAEKFYAWPPGPVVEELYRKYEPFRGRPILVENLSVPDFDEDVTGLLENIWKNFAKYSDSDLRVETNRLNSPWDRVYDRDFRNVEITTELIREYFKALGERFAHV